MRHKLSYSRIRLTEKQPIDPTLKRMPS
jgi:hypothetical protein